MIDVASPVKTALALGAVALTLIACSGGGGGDAPAADSSLIIGGPSGQPADDATSEQIQTTAARRASQGLGGNLSSLQRLSDEALLNLNNDGAVTALLGDTDTTALGVLDTNNSNFLSNSIGVNDPLANVQRSGNIITIDPDEQQLCADEFPLVDSLNDNAFNCAELMTDLTVQIDAQSDETGIITYLFQNDPVMLIGYSPMGASYELRLAGLQRVTDREAQIEGISASSDAAILSGAIRLSAMVSNDQPGSEAGELALEVTQALSLTPSDGSASRISLQPSTVFSISADEATGNVSTSVNWGALQLIAEGGDSDGNFTTSAINLGGLTGNASFNTNTQALNLTNVGIKGVPLTVSINQVESLRVNLGTFGLTLDDDSGMVTLNGALAANLTLNNTMNWLETLGSEVTANVGINAPAGTTLLEQFNGSTQLGAGGPLTVSADVASNGQSLQQTVTVNQGECVGSAEEDDAAADSLGIGLEIVSCD